MSFKQLTTRFPLDPKPSYKPKGIIVYSDKVYNARRPLDPVKINLEHLKTKYDKQAIRVLSFDPGKCYELAGNEINPYSRFQTNLSIITIFPNPAPGICACGCERILTGRKTRWFNSDCHSFALHVLTIMYGSVGTISRYLDAISGNDNTCMSCSEVLGPDAITRAKGGGEFGYGEHVTEIDHILPVNQGGGGSWLSNYQRLCIPCHDIKSKADKKVK